MLCPLNNCMKGLQTQNMVSDKIDNVVNTLYDFVHEFIVDVGMIEDNEELPDFNIDDLA